MGTRSVIAIPDAEHGWRGRYCHWDGYPSGVGESLRKIVLRDGLTTAVRTLTEQHNRWSSVNERYTEASDLAEWDRKHLVPGYGTAPDDEPSADEAWVYADGDDWGTEWAYLLGEGGIAVYERRFGTPEDDEGHGTGMFGFGASDTVAGGHWRKRGFVAFTDESGMYAIEDGEEVA